MDLNIAPNSVPISIKQKLPLHYFLCCMLFISQKSFHFLIIMQKAKMISTTRPSWQRARPRSLHPHILVLTRPVTTSPRHTTDTRDLEHLSSLFVVIRTCGNVEAYGHNGDHCATGRVNVLRAREIKAWTCSLTCAHKDHGGRKRATRTRLAAAEGESRLRTTEKCGVFESQLRGARVAHHSLGKLEKCKVGTLRNWNFTLISNFGSGGYKSNPR